MGKKAKTTVRLIFDEEKRREFLTGFHKRKVQRQKEAKEKFEKKLKEERKRLKQEAKEEHKKLVKSYAPIPELEDLLSDEYEDDDVTVKVEELSMKDMAEKNNWIGINRPNMLDMESTSESEQSDNTENDKIVPGMELTPKKCQKTIKKDVEVKSEPKSVAEVKKYLKKQAVKRLQKSKTFQKKNKLERQKQRKKSFHKKKQDDKIKQKLMKKRR